MDGGGLRERGESGDGMASDRRIEVPQRQAPAASPRERWQMTRTSQRQNLPPASPSAEGDESRAARRLAPWIPAAIAAVTVLAYARVCGFEFVNYDDPEYVYQNPHVTGGLAWENVAWAFTTPHAANWHPLTWISHMLDCQLFGLNAGGHHATNLLLHVAATVLLYLWLRDMTAAAGRSGFVAALFALHPLHVESVAWVSERKDVLSATFWMAALLAYGRYARRPAAGTYLAATVLFVLGLLSKPMVVTLPFALLLLDYWPLRRLGEPQGLRRCVVEKLPWLALSAAASVVTFLVQRSAGAVAPGNVFPLSYRIGNAIVSYAIYLRKTVWPSDLAVFYPAARELPLADVLLAFSLLSVLTALAFVARRPYLVMGWAWFLGTLVPVIGLVKQGEQALADRFTYLPHVGLFVAATWGLGDLAARRLPRRISSASAIAALAAAGVVTYVQVGHWRNTETLFEHAIAVTEGNHVAHLNLGSALLEKGKLEAALHHLERAVEFSWNMSPSILASYASALLTAGRHPEAIERCHEALRLDPDNERARFTLGMALAARGELERAMEEFRAVLARAPDHTGAHNQLGLALAARGDLDAAIEHYQAALRANPRFAAAHNNLAMALEEKGDPDRALAHYRETVRLAPEEPLGHANLGQVLLGRGLREEGEAELREALRLARAREAQSSMVAELEARLRELDRSR